MRSPASCISYRSVLSSLIQRTVVPVLHSITHGHMRAWMTFQLLGDPPDPAAKVLIISRHGLLRYRFFDDLSEILICSLPVFISVIYPSIYIPKKVARSECHKTKPPIPPVFLSAIGSAVLIYARCRSWSPATTADKDTI